MLESLQQSIRQLQADNEELKARDERRDRAHQQLQTRTEELQATVERQRRALARLEAIERWTCKHDEVCLRCP